MTINATDLISDIKSEVNRATTKFPTWPTDPIHAAAVLAEEQGELSQAVLQLVYEPHKSSIENVRMEAIQVAAMALRFLISLDADMYEWEEGDQHTQVDDTTMLVEQRLERIKEKVSA